ncbi:MAG: hypothetical protein JNL58_03565 [Planctomyces sp.]|nr:hypothetical protein [Planctomyces sp.]
MLKKPEHSDGMFQFFVLNLKMAVIRNDLNAELTDPLEWFLPAKRHIPTYLVALFVKVFVVKVLAEDNPAVPVLTKILPEYLRC